MPARTTLIQAIYCRPLAQRHCLQEWQVLLLLCSLPLQSILKWLSLQTTSRKHLRAIVLMNSTKRSLQRVFVTTQ
jgi:hypothetical protein